MDQAATESKQLTRASAKAEKGSAKTFSLKNLSPILAAVSVLALTIGFIDFPIYLSILIFYCFIVVTILVNGKVGIILLALCFPLMPKSYEVLTGDLVPSLFYASFLIGVVIIVYRNIIGYRLKLPTLMLDKYLLILTAYMLFSLLFISSQKVYGFEKFRYFLMNLALFYLTICLIKKERDLEDVIKAILYFGILFTFFATLSFVGLEKYFGNTFPLTDRFSTMGLNPIMVSRYLSYAILVEVYYLFKYLSDWKSHLAKMLLLSLLILYQLFLSMLTGSRGPLAASLFAIILLIVISLRSNLKLGYLIGLLSAIGLTLLLAISLVPANIAGRLLLADQAGQSTALIRLWLNMQALIMFWQNMITGSGLGGFNAIYLKYPHNIHTEVLAELGLIGFALLLIIFYLAIKYFLFLRNRVKILNYYFLFTILLSAYINANLSGHIGSNFFFFFSLGLLYAAREISGSVDKDKTLS